MEYRSVLAILLEDDSDEWSSTSDDEDDNLPVVIQHKNPRDKGKGKDQEDLPVELSDDDGMDIDDIEPTAAVPFQGRHDMRKRKPMINGRWIHPKRQLLEHQHSTYKCPTLQALMLVHG
ncbi:hypothetical protein V8D89_015857 [Ganoderma adspersum]